MNLGLVAISAVAGLMVGLTGIGSGSLTAPLLLLVFGVAPLAAVGTNLWAAAITKIVASPVHQRLRLIDWGVARRLWWGSLSTSALTLLWVRFRPLNSETVRFLTASIAVVTLFSAVGMLAQKRLHQMGRRFRLDDAGRFSALQGPMTVLAGAVLGIFVTLTSVGAGTLGTVFLAYLYPLRLTPPRLIATDIVHAIPLAVFAGSGHLLLGHVEGRLLANLLLGSVPGALIGATLSARLPHVLLRGLLAIVLIWIGIKLWITAI